MKPVVLGTRGSALAQAQTRLIRDALKRACPSRTFEIHVIRTQGDRISEGSGVTNALPGKGIFTAELERALQKKKIHLAVHSLKDMPTELTEGLVIAAVPKRADARDVLVTRGPGRLTELPADAKVATGSPRRSAQLTLARADLRVVEIRGNIDTRLRKFRETTEWSGLVLAAAGLERLQPDTRGLTMAPLPFAVMLPAPGQGALALQTRDDEEEIIELLKLLNDPASASEVTAEREFLKALGGGCLEPVAAHAQPAGGDLLRLEAVAWLFGETKPRRGFLEGKVGEAGQMGIDLAVEISR